jgi:shikimate kinase / 3-dehydroquinate synthase
MAVQARALVFIGFMGAGKSTAAAEVARALGVDALDADRLLEDRFGHSIAREFELHGEEAFRAREQELVCELLAEVGRAGPGRAGPQTILALGGGSVLSPRIREALAPHTVVLLDIDPELAWARVRDRGEERPLARDREEFAALHAERRALYEGLADAILPAAVPGVAVRALGALRALGCAPAGTKLLWANAASGEYPALVGRGLLGGAGGEREAGGAGETRGDAGTPEPGATGTTGWSAEIWPLDRAASRSYCVTDETVAALHPPPPGAVRALIAIPPGESHKTLASAELVWRELARAGMTRADHLVALGGGVVGDLAGFCAATYQRGVPVVQVPTTLVAQVDSAYGGKTGVDLSEGKNYVGAYHQPAAVIVDPDALATLPAAELDAGWVEVLKTALLAGGELWERIAADEPVDERTILACARLKLAVVAADERDAGRRQALNLGHTVGHAIETATGYSRYRHGEAVGLGLLAALRLSGQGDLRAQVRALLAAHRQPVAMEGDVDVDDVVRAVARDKKRLGAGVPFVLLDAPGAVRIGCEVPEADVRAAVAELA